MYMRSSKKYARYMFLFVVGTASVLLLLSGNRNTQNSSVPTPPYALNYNSGTVTINSQNDRIPSEHGDINLSLRGYQALNDPSLLQLVPYNGDTDFLAPKIDTILNQDQITLTSAYQVNHWDWGSNSRGGPITDPYPITMIGLQTSIGESILLPQADYNIGQGYQASVMYAEQNRITLAYNANDTVAIGYVLHLENIKVDPQLLEAYNRLSPPGTIRRSSLPALREGEVVGTATGNQVLIAIRDTGQFMDPRSCKDWWINCDAITEPLDPVQPSTTLTPTPSDILPTNSIPPQPTTTIPIGGDTEIPGIEIKDYEEDNRPFYEDDLESSLNSCSTMDAPEGKVGGGITLLPHPEEENTRIGYAFMFAQIEFPYINHGGSGKIKIDDPAHENDFGTILNPYKPICPVVGIALPNAGIDFTQEYPGSINFAFSKNGIDEEYKEEFCSYPMPKLGNFTSCMLMTSALNPSSPQIATGPLNEMFPPAKKLEIGLSDNEKSTLESSVSFFTLDLTYFSDFIDTLVSDILDLIGLGEYERDPVKNEPPEIEYTKITYANYCSNDTTPAIHFINETSNKDSEKVSGPLALMMPPQKIELNFDELCQNREELEEIQIREYNSKLPLDPQSFCNGEIPDKLFYVFGGREEEDYSIDHLSIPGLGDAYQNLYFYLQYKASQIGQKVLQAPNTASLVTIKQSVHDGLKNVDTIQDIADLDNLNNLPQCGAVNNNNVSVPLADSINNEYITENTYEVLLNNFDPPQLFITMEYHLPLMRSDAYFIDRNKNIE